MGAGRIAATAISVVLSALPALATAQSTAPVVRIDTGQVSGVLDRGVTAFKAIPYAAPPVGVLRWRPPEAAKAWAGVRAGDTFGPVCPQTLQAPPTDLPNQSEDCLSVNVFVPGTVRPGAKLPVMVWIHGGGFTVGAGGQPFYDGAALARHGVVVVTLNYRLGRLGFFAHPALVREAGDRGLFGNYGVMDQIAALKWVRRNIAAFGGDPHKVTAFGESAGGMAMNSLMLAPAARGLFDQAITESGLGRNPMRSLSDAEAMDNRFGVEHGVNGDDAAALAALRALPTSAFVPNGVSMTNPGQPGLIKDGRLLTQEVAEGFAAGRAAPVPFIIGTNDNEDSLWPDARIHPEKTLATIPAATLTEVRKTCVADTASDADVAGTFIVDTRFTEPARFLAHAQAATGQPVWRYRFSYVQADLRGKTPGASHAAEVQYVFGSLGVRGPKPTADDQRIADLLQTYWTNFAKTGDPNGHGLPPWPKDSNRHDETLSIANDQLGAVSDFRKPCLDVAEDFSRASQPH